MSNQPKQVAVVTGASSGIGREIAVGIARDGWDVAFSFHSDSDGAEKTRQAVKAEGRRCLGARCDVGISEDVDRFFDDVVTKLGTPTLLVNNAGVQTWASLLELKEEDWDRTIRTNLKGTFLNTQRAARLMVDAGLSGVIINIGSGCNKTPFPKLVDYSASKGGLDRFTEVAATELGEHGIRVNCVAPGAILIERTKREAPEYEETWGNMAPLGRVGTPEDIVNAVVFLASDKSSFVTGQTLYVDGGVFTRPNWPEEKYD